MERMTKRLASGAADYAVNMAELTHPQKSAYRQKCIKALAAYEETGLEPEEVAALVKAQAEGRVVVLPVKTVFEPVWDAGGTCDLRCPERFDGLDTCQGCPKAVPYAHQREYRTEDIIGKTVFLTPAEAEGALGGGGDGCTDVH